MATDAVTTGRHAQSRLVVINTIRQVLMVCIAAPDTQ